MTAESSHPARPRTGRPLQATLLSLVLVPVVGLTAVAGLFIGEKLQHLREAEGALQQVQAAIALDDVRSAVGREAVTAFALDHASEAEAPAAEADLAAAAEVTNQALKTAGTGPARESLNWTVRGLRVELAMARVAAAGATKVSLPIYQESQADLTDLVNTRLGAARKVGLQGGLATTVADLQRVSRADSLADQELTAYLVAAQGQAEGTLGSLPELWGAARQASAEVVATTDPAVAKPWSEATSQDATSVLDREIAAVVAAPTAVVPDSPAQLARATAARDTALESVRALAAQRVTEQAQAQAAEARSSLNTLLALCGLVVAATLTGTLVVRRMIAGPLGRLAAQSRAIAAGELVDVDEHGPAEVRVVARGLAAAVDSLRQVQTQAEAIAAGDLDSDVVRTPVPGPLGRLVHASVTQVLAAFHEREQLQADLAHQAAHDALTELPNRAQSLVLTERALHRAARHGGRVGLLFVDLDHFKAVNDSFGHAAGDELLRIVAARMHSTVRGGDVVCRLGGDEFLVVVEGVEDEQGLLDLGGRLIAALSAPTALAGLPQAQHVRVGASIGVAVSTPGTLDPERLVRDADAAAYRAKNAGRGVVEVFDDELRAELSARAELESALRHGLETGELVLYYQPVLDLATGRTKSVEALVRWVRPGQGLVPPDAFIPVAEASSLICDLGRWALAEATAQLVRWDTEGNHRAGLDVAVNISGRHLAQAHLLDDVTDALTASGIHPSRLTIEITETVLVDEPLALEHLRSLREIGVRVAIDDFGTGYTSIGQLSRLPVDVLKIDRSFVSSHEHGNADLVRLLISAAHSFSLGVVAEGVEEDGQLSALLAASCDAAQGYLFARPVPAADLPAAAILVSEART